jgi:hypothetical protein
MHETQGNEREKMEEKKNSLLQPHRRSRALPPRKAQYITPDAIVKVNNWSLGNTTRASHFWFLNNI